MSDLFLKGFNFIEFLKRRSFLGQLHPATGSDDQTEPIVGLLVSVPTALGECQQWSGQELPRNEFIRYLKDNNIFLGDIDDFAKAKDQRSKRIIGRNVISNARLIDIADAIDVSTLRIVGGQLSGRKGYIEAFNQNDMQVSVANRSKRHHGSIKKQLGFMQPCNSYHEDIAKFSLDRLPTAEEGTALRKLLGLNRRPALSEARKKALQDQAREKMGGRSSKVAL